MSRHPLRLPTLAALTLSLVACGATGDPAGLDMPVAGATPSAPPADALALVTGLQARHRGPRSVSFTQDVLDHRPGAEPAESSMDEWMLAPSRLRIDIRGEDMSLLFHTRGRTAVTPAGVQESSEVNAALVLMLDIFVQEPAAWLPRAAALGVDTAVLSEQDWDGAAHLVLGAEAGQLERTQLWFDARTWLPVRFLERREGRDGGVRVFEGRALDYRLFGEVVFHTRFEFLVDGEPLLSEVYRDIVIDPPLDPALFDPAVIARRFDD